jgi:Major Facilitator Superfamily
LLPGLGAITLGLLLFSRISVDGDYLTDVLPAMVLIGTGAGLSFPSLMSLAMSGVAREDAGLASGLVNTTLQVGGAIGLAVLATMSTNRTGDLLAEGASEASALTDGFKLAFLIGAGIAFAAIVVAVTVLKPAEAASQEEPVTDGEFGPAEPAFSSEAA